MLAERIDGVHTASRVSLRDGPERAQVYRYSPAPNDEAGTRRSSAVSA